MYKNFEALNSQTHANLKINPVNGYEFAKKFHLTSLVLHEFPECAAHYPIVFVKKPDSDQYQPVASLGLEVGENLFVDEAGAWKVGAYVPGTFRRYPFGLATVPGREGMIICFDKDSQNLSQENGEPLFNSDGEETDLLKKIRSFLVEMYNSELFAEKFTAKLQALDLLAPGNLQVNTPQGPNRSDGVYLVDEDKLSKLSAEEFLSLREHGFLTAIYSHMSSLLQIKKFFTHKKQL
jgi:hypothetical protein